MDLHLVNQLAMIGVSLIGVKDMYLSPIEDCHEIQKEVFLEMYDIAELEKEIEERKRRGELSFNFKGYTIRIK